MVLWSMMLIWLFVIRTVNRKYDFTSNVKKSFFISILTHLIGKSHYPEIEALFAYVGTGHNYEFNNDLRHLQWCSYKQVLIK
ncbi:hypothetical protein B0A69_13170 [Chryseobacterium shigense]|uniref:Uncharacterized protein n=1 Tax=Chryseobacterium shigense TaxID=297244 RepID=A0A1N7HTK8_9FLAO|nr:hypothetical protein B0A69_13170 [Chryseobacterium shigense]SIS28156.1 hypothetical protein SAMN05421639_10190 [Chryseobacterium shigense]